jgi:hypothetical protein
LFYWFVICLLLLLLLLAHSLQGAPPSAPDIHARPEDTTSSGLYTPSSNNPNANPTAPAAAAPGGYYNQQQQQHYEKPWEQHTPGTLSNPYTTAPAASQRTPHYPAIPTAADDDSTFNHDNSSSRPQGSSKPHVKYAQVPGGYKDVSPSGPGGYDAGGYTTVDYGSAKPWGESGAVASELERQLQDEARQARLEWEAEQKEVERQRQQQATRSSAREDDGGWGASGSSRDQGRRGQQQQQKEKQAPDWLDLLGKVFGGGPAYGVAAPDL